MNEINSTRIAKDFKRGKKRFNFKIYLGFLSLFIILVGLVGYLVVLQKPIRRKVPAAGVARTCTGPAGSTRSLLIVAHRFNSTEECVACRDQGNCGGTDPAGLVGQFPACGTTATCTTAQSCTIQTASGTGEGSCQLSGNAPSCSVYQLDCLNGIYPNASIIDGSIAFDCSGCSSPASSPTLTPTLPVTTPSLTPSPSPAASITPSVSPSPSPTLPLSPSPSPNPTKTPTPTPTLTPGPSATPVPVACGSKSCENTTNPCKAGLICQQANDGSNYCTLPEFKEACKKDPNLTTCCSAQANSPTPTEIIVAKATATASAKTTEIPPAGIARFGAIFGAISLAVILLGLVL